MIIAITGSIACGKSIVIEYLKEKGYKVISLDEISHYFFNKKEVNDLIKDAFCIKIKSKVTRERIGKIVFNDSEKLTKLNKILHPLIINKMEEEIKLARANGESLFIEVPLLYEEGLENYFDNIILIYVSKSIQIERLMKRNGYTREEAIVRINSQMDINKKIEKARKLNNLLIDNNKDLVYTYKAIDKILEDIK